jgi:SOS-response transcriptional repressor LexA
MKQFVDKRMRYHQAQNVEPRSVPGIVRAAPLSSIKQQIEAWANQEVPKSPLSRNELARRSGISSATIHRIMGLDETYHATPKWQNVTALAKALGVKPPAIPHPEQAEGMAEADAMPILAPSGADNPLQNTTLSNTQSQWQVKGMALAAMGYLPGDYFILDQSVQPANRDCVIAQVVDYDTGTAETVLRVYMDGFLVTPNYVADGSPRLFVDGKIVQVSGVITQSWRTRRH